MTDKATHMEARLMGLSKRRAKDGDWFEIRLQVFPEDMPNELYAVALGTRMGVAMVQIADDETEQPVEKRKFEDMPPSQQAGIRCNDTAFQNWCNVTAHEQDWAWRTDMPIADVTAAYVRFRCGVDSRSQLNGAIASSRWETMNTNYLADTRLPEQR